MPYFRQQPITLLRVFQRIILADWLVSKAMQDGHQGRLVDIYFLINFSVKIALPSSAANERQKFM